MFGDRPAVLTLTDTTALVVPFNCPLAGVTATQEGVPASFQGMAAPESDKEVAV